MFVYISMNHLVVFVDGQLYLGKKIRIVDNQVILLGSHLSYL